MQLLIDQQTVDSLQIYNSQYILSPYVDNVKNVATVRLMKMINSSSALRKAQRQAIPFREGQPKPGKASS